VEADVEQVGMCSSKVSLRQILTACRVASQSWGNDTPATASILLSLFILGGYNEIANLGNSVFVF
jgi:hypothetical protein